MNCIKCNTHVSKKTLYRTKPKGQMPDWMCIDCLKKEEPELAKNHLAENQIERIIELTKAK